MDTKKKLSIIKLLFSFGLLFMFAACETPESEFKKAQDINTIEAYNNFIEKYPTDTLVIEAKNHLASLEYINFAKDPSLEDLLKFMNKYPGSNYLDSVKRILLEANDYKGVSITASIIYYKDLCSFNSKEFHSKAIIIFERNTTVQLKGCSDLIIELGHPQIIKLSFTNDNDTTKEIVIKKGLERLIILRTPDVMILPKRIGIDLPGPFGGSNFGFAELQDGEIIFKISRKDYFDLAILFTEAKKGDLIIFDSSFVTKIM